jgi:hypothetical protein
MTEAASAGPLNRPAPLISMLLRGCGSLGFRRRSAGILPMRWQSVVGSQRSQCASCRPLAPDYRLRTAAILHCENLQRYWGRSAAGKSQCLAGCIDARSCRRDGAKARSPSPASCSSPSGTITCPGAANLNRSQTAGQRGSSPVNQIVNKQPQLWFSPSGAASECLFRGFAHVLLYFRPPSLRVLHTNHNPICHITR